jgi:hypothetical protein
MWSRATRDETVQDQVDRAGVTGETATASDIAGLWERRRFPYELERQPEIDLAPEVQLRLV